MQKLLKLIQIVYFTIILSMLLSIFLYRGGCPFHIHPEGYSFTHNFLSDLGRALTFAGSDNNPSRSLFIISLALLCTGFILWGGIIFLYTRSKKTSGGIIYTVTMITSGLFFLGAGVLPWDTHFVLHVWSVNVAFFLFFFTALLLLKIQKKNGFPLSAQLSNVIIMAALIIQLFILLFGPHYGTETGRPVQALVQKIIFSFFLIYFQLQILFMKKITSN